jgi:zinc protease
VIDEGRNGGTMQDEWRQMKKRNSRCVCHALCVTCRGLLAAIALSFCLALPLHAEGPDTSPAFQRMVLPNGLVVILKEEHSLPFVTMNLLVDGGSWKDPPQYEGLARLTGRGLLLGIGEKTAERINYELDHLGANLSTSIRRDFMNLHLQVLKKNLDGGFRLFYEALTMPSFPEMELKQEVERTAAALRSQEDDPGWVAEKEFQKALFLDTPYGHLAEGTKESLRRMTRDRVVQFHKDFYRPNNAILAIIGDITVEEAKTRLFPALERWQKGVIPAVAPEGAYGKGPKTTKVNRAITQANIIIGNEGVTRSNPDYYAVTVMNYILGGGGFSSRLMDGIRERRGLAYSVSSYFDPGKLPGDFQVVLQTKNGNAREAINLVLNDMERMQTELVSEEELARAKKYLVGSFPLRLNTQAKQAAFILQVEFYGLGLDYIGRYPAIINAVTREDLQGAAKKYLHPDRPIIVIVADLKEAAIE